MCNQSLAFSVHAPLSEQTDPSGDHAVPRGLQGGPGARRAAAAGAASTADVLTSLHVFLE